MTPENLAARGRGACDYTVALALLRSLRARLGASAPSDLEVVAGALQLTCTRGRLGPEEARGRSWRSGRWPKPPEARRVILAVDAGSAADPVSFTLPGHVVIALVGASTRGWADGR